MVAPNRELPTVLEEDLRALSAEARKKFPAIKDAAERGILRLRSLVDMSPDKYIPVISRSEDILRPFLLSCETKNPALHVLAISSIQKLFMHNVVSLSSLPSVLRKLSALVDGEDTVQLKLLQTLVALINTTVDLHDDNLSQVLVVLFRLHSSKNPNVHNTSSATLRQVISMLFDRTIAEYQSDSLSANLSTPQQIEESHNNNDNSNNNIAINVGDNTTTDSSNADNNATDAEVASITDNVVPPPTTSSAPRTRESSPIQSPFLTPTSPTFQLQPLFTDEQVVVVGNNVPSSLLPHARDAYLLLQDLCLLTGGDPPAWLPVSNLSRAFGLELIELVLTNHYELFLGLPEFSFVLQDRVCPLVITCFRLKAEFQHTLRLVRIVGVFVNKFCHLLVTECELLLSRLLKMLEPENPLWMHTVALEIFKTFCENEQLLKSFCVYYDMDNNSAKIFEQLVDSIGRYTKNMSTCDGLQVSHNTKNRYIDALSQVEAPVIKESYAVTTAVECLLGIVNAIYQLAVECTLTSNGTECKEKEQKQEVCVHMTEVSWCPILAALSALLNKSVDEILVQTLLRTLQSFVHACCLLSMDTSRDAFLVVLCKCSLPPLYSSHLFSQEKNTSGSLSLSHSSSGTNIGLSTSGNMEEATPTLKNVHAAKTLTNIAHSLGAMLDVSGWALILEALDYWDRIVKLNSYSIQEEVGSPGMLSRVASAELTNLNTAFQSLFKSSNTLDEASIIGFVSALVSVSNGTLSTLGPNAPATNSTFGLSKILEISLTNVSRISVIWDIIAFHIIEAGNHKNTAVRIFAAEALTSLVQTVLPQYTIKQKQNQENKNEANGMMEVKITSSLADLAKTTYADVREKVLLAVDNVLQSVGHVLTEGWPFLLYILTSVAANNDKQLVPAAFRSLQLVCTDFLSSLGPTHLALFIDAVGAFCKQTTDINISLTAVGLLWSVADYFILEQSDPDSRYKIISDNKLTEQNTERSGFFYRYANTLLLLDRLWLCLFDVLLLSSLDSRPEVRNCAHISLFKTLSTHGNSLCGTTWRVILWDLLFPLIDDVKRLTASAASDKIDGDLGGGVVMLVHHSRNTAQKQWDETKVLAMSGMVRVFKISFDVLSNMPEVQFEGAWKRLIDYLEEGCLSSSKEVSLAALHNLQDVVQAHVALVSCPVAIRDHVWAALERIAFEITTGPNATEYSRSQADLVTLLSELYTKTSTFILPSNIQRLIRITHPLGLIPPARVTSDPSPLQSSVLDLLRKMSPIPDDIFPLVITQLLKFIAHAINYTYNPTHQDPNNPNADYTPHIPPEIQSKLGPYGYYPLAEASLNIINELFSAENVEKSVRASVYGDIVKVIGATMMTKYANYQGSLWKSAVNSFIALMGLGLPAISSLREIQSHMVWTELMDCIQIFLLEQGNSGEIPPEKRAETI